MIPAIILAAGASSRMGRPKALLPLPGGGCFLLRIAETLRAAGIEEIAAVVGHDVQAIRARVHAEAARLLLVDNPHPLRGQLSSLLSGLDAVVRASPHAPAVLVTTVDLPLVSPDTVRAVLAAWRASRALVVRPARGGRHGHPVIFDAGLFDELRRADLHAGARRVISSHEGASVEVPVEDAGAFDDVDTPADYERLIGLPFPGR